jgi:hypothetical protein
MPSPGRLENLLSDNKNQGLWEVIPGNFSKKSFFLARQPRRLDLGGTTGRSKTFNVLLLADITA